MSLEVQGINSGPLQVEQTLAPQRDLVVEQQVGSLQQLLHTPQVDLQTRTDSLTRRVQEKLSPSETVQNPNGLHLINTRLWLHQLSEIHARPMTIKDVPTAEWDKLFDTYDSIWFMGIYKPSSASQNHAKKMAS